MLPSVQQLVDYLESRDLFSRYQSGLRRKYSTQTAITFLTDSIRRNMDNGLLTGAIFVDFRKAFDTFDHKILLDKLQLFGICGSEHTICFRGRCSVQSSTSCFWSSVRFYIGPVAIFIVCH